MVNSETSHPFLIGHSRQSAAEVATATVHLWRRERSSNPLGNVIALTGRSTSDTHTVTSETTVYLSSEEAD